jgi:hypothetical protein
MYNGIKINKSINLVVKECREVGELFLSLEDMRVLDMPMFSDSYGLAHDIIEHINGAEKIGGIEDEFEALGVIFAIRGQFNDLRRDSMGSSYTPHANLASDVYQLFMATECADRKLRHSLVRKGKAEFHEDMEDIWSEFLSLTRSESDERPSAHTLAEFKKAFRNLFCSGIQKHRRRFVNEKTVDDDAKDSSANSLFYDLERAISKVSNWAEHEGQEFEICIQDEGRVNVFEREPEYEEY